MAESVSELDFRQAEVIVGLILDDEESTACLIKRRKALYNQGKEVVLDGSWEHPHRFHPKQDNGLRPLKGTNFMPLTEGLEYAFVEVDSLPDLNDGNTGLYFRQEGKDDRLVADISPDGRTQWHTTEDMPEETGMTYLESLLRLAAASPLR